MSTVKLINKVNSGESIRTAPTTVWTQALSPELPELSVVAERLIARASVQMSIWRQKGNQYHYSGHVYSSMANTAKIATKLALLSGELHILKLVPP